MSLTMSMTVGSSALVENALRELGFQNVRRGSRGFMALCRFHSERNPSFSINDQGLWKCFTCGVKGNFKQLYEKLGVSMSMDWRDACKVLGLELAPRDEFRKKLIKRMHLPEGFSVYSLPEEVPPFIAKRVSWETIQRFKLGAAPGKDFRDRCIIPIFYRGRDVAYHARDCSGRSYLKYLNPKNLEIKDYVFNYDGVTPGAEVFVVEGAFSCMSMVEKGFTNTVATFGTQYTAAQIKHIASLNPSNIVLCFDRDPSKIKDGKENGHAGQKAAKKMGATLSQLFDVSVMLLPVGRDPNDCTAEELRLRYQKRKKYEELFDGSAGKR